MSVVGSRQAPGLAAVAALLLCGPAAADDGTTAALPGFTFRGRLEWITAAAGASPRDTDQNPRNVLGVPQAGGGSELRPDLRVEHGSTLQLFARPRLRAQVTKARAAGEWGAEEREASAEWLDLYGAWRISDGLALAYGFQNFQWGPAELMSPSNRIFHETGLLRDPLYAVRGKHLARVNLSLGSAWSAVVLAEVEPNGAEPFVAAEPFDPKAQAKVEWSAADGRGYVGVTVGAGEKARGWFGEYGAASLTDALSIYADAVHQAGSRAWYPVDAGAGAVSFAHTATGRDLRTLALGGIRYTFAAGADLRLEYVFDEAGWTEAQLALAARAASFASGPPAPETLNAWLDPGFEIVGRQHAYLSLRLPDLPPAKKTALQLRYLAALEDGSGAAFATASFDATDSVVLFASAMGTHGSNLGALSRLLRATAVVGAVVSW
jgi:hypothetical protein